MPKVSKATAKKSNDQGPVADHADELLGYAVNFVEFRQDIDATPLLKGLPDDRCQCPHWGYVIKGKLTMRFADHEEEYQAGDAFYSPPRHVPVKHEPGTQIVQFSLAHELAKTEQVLVANFAKMMGR